MNGVIPQGSCHGPLCFIVYINDIDLPSNFRTHKYTDVDNRIYPRKLGMYDATRHRYYKSWSDSNQIKQNNQIIEKKEMLITFQQKPHPTQALHVNDTVIE